MTPGSQGALATATLGVLFGVSAWVFGAAPLWVPAGTLVALAGGTAGWVLVAARGTVVHRQVGGARVQEGDEVPVQIEVRATAAPFPGGEVRDTLVRRPVELRAAGRGVRIEARARFDRRGLHRLAPPQVTVADPFGLSARRAGGGADAGEILVLPRIEPVLVAGSGQEAGRPAGGRVTGLAATELDGIGPLRDGTPASRVYWPAVARGAEPLERRFRAEGDGRPLVVLDPRGPASAEDLDAAVRAAASLVVHLAREGGCWLLLPAMRRPAVVEPSLAGWPQLHARLAVLTDRAAPSLAEVGGRRGAVVFVSAMRRDRPPSAVGAGGAARVLVVPGELAHRRPTFSVGACRGYLLGRPARRVRAGVA